MTLEQDIRDHLALYINSHDDESLDAFRRWFSLATWNVARGNDPAAHALTFQVEAALAEFTGGYTTEDDLRAALFELAADGWARFAVVRLDPMFKPVQEERWETRTAGLRLSAGAST